MDRTEELLILTHGAEAVKLAKELSEKCPTGYLIVHDHESNTVYYRNTNPPEDIIKTKYTEDHVMIAHRKFMPPSPHRIVWDEMNTVGSGNKRYYYTANGK